MVVVLVVCLKLLIRSSLDNIFRCSLTSYFPLHCRKLRSGQSECSDLNVMLVPGQCVVASLQVIIGKIRTAGITSPAPHSTPSSTPPIDSSPHKRSLYDHCYLSDSSGEARRRHFTNKPPSYTLLLILRPPGARNTAIMKPVVSAFNAWTWYGYERSLEASRRVLS